MDRKPLASYSSAIGAPAPGTAIVVLNWNGWSDTIECLESLFRLDPGPQRIVVCDNASEDNSLDHLIAWAEGRLNTIPPTKADETRRLSFPPVVKPIPYKVYERAEAEAGGDLPDDAPRLAFIRTGANLGFAGGNNVGLRYLLADSSISAIWILNNDTVVERSALGALVSEALSNPAAGLIGATVLEYERPSMIQAQAGAKYLRCIGWATHIGAKRKWSDRLKKNSVEQQVDYILGASMFATRAFLEKAGLMDESYFLYYEELDWATKAAGRGALGYAPDAIVYHKMGRSIGTGRRLASGSALSLYYLNRNRLLIARRHWPRFLLTTAAVNLFMTALLLMRFRLREAKAVLRATAVALSKPLDVAFRSAF
ncbi:MAG TPA: glycosyltransferase family 2 protein [Hyphomicrobiaceae bacterium]